MAVTLHPPSLVPDKAVRIRLKCPWKYLWSQKVETDIKDHLFPSSAWSLGGNHLPSVLGTNTGLSSEVAVAHDYGAGIAGAPRATQSVPLEFQEPDQCIPLLSKGPRQGTWMELADMQTWWEGGEERVGGAARKDPLTPFPRAPAATSTAGEGKAKGATTLDCQFSYCQDRNCIQNCHYLSKKRKLLPPLCEETHFPGCKGGKWHQGDLEEVRKCHMQECLPVTSTVQPERLVSTTAGVCYDAVDGGESSISSEATENAIRNILAMLSVTDGPWWSAVCLSHMSVIPEDCFLWVVEARIRVQDFRSDRPGEGCCLAKMMQSIWLQISVGKWEGYCLCQDAGGKMGGMYLHYFDSFVPRFAY